MAVRNVSFSPDEYGNPVGYETISPASNKGFTIDFGIDGRGGGQGELADASIQFSLESLVDGEPVYLHLRLLDAYVTAPDAVPRESWIEVSGYAGEGVITLDDFHRTDFTAVGSITVQSGDYEATWIDLSLDVTRFVKSLKDSGASYAGFYLQTFWIGPSPSDMPSITLSEPKLGSDPVILPEPSALLLASCAIAVLLAWSRRRPCNAA